MQGIRVCRLQSGREGKHIFLFEDGLVVIGCWSIGFTENVPRRERGFVFRESGIRVIALQGVQNVTMFVKCVCGTFVLVNTHL